MIRGYEIRYSHVPQSNQRGIETQSSYEVFPRSGSSLNRTSVGLKLWALDRAIPFVEASIEPAWD